jgi:hypothetical protein
LSCPLCRERKGKRQCPAKGERICSQCCGSKRLVEIDCPPDCVFLSGAHAAAWEGRETERARDRRRIAHAVQGLTDAPLQLLLVGIVGIDRMRSERRELQDRLVLDAVQALRKTVETRGHGILYDHAAEDLRAQGLLHDLRGLFEAKDAQGRPVSPDDRDLLPALKALEAMIGDCLREGGSSGFLELASRVAAELQRDAQPKPPQRLIVAP